MAGPDQKLEVAMANMPQNCDKPKYSPEDIRKYGIDVAEKKCTLQRKELKEESAFSPEDLFKQAKKAIDQAMLDALEHNPLGSLAKRQIEKKGGKILHVVAEMLDDAEKLGNQTDLVGYKNFLKSEMPNVLNYKKIVETMVSSNDVEATIRFELSYQTYLQKRQRLAKTE